MIRLEQIFTVRVVYKSGYTHDFECTKFKLKQGTAEWEAVSSANAPIALGLDDVAAVWQIGHRRRLRFGRG